MSKGLQMRKYLHYTNLLIYFFILLSIGCGEDKDRSPIIFSMKAEPEIVLPGENSTITVEADDPDTDKLLYTWTASGGTIAGNGETASWTSPKEEGKYEVDVTVSDGINKTSQTIKVRVWTPRPGDYYPLAIGNKWTFEDSNKNTVEFEIVDKITISSSSVEAFVKQTTHSGLADAANFAYVAKDSKAVYQYAMGGSNASGDTIIFTPELPLYKFPLVPETSWEIKFNITVPEGFIVGSGTATYEVLSETDLSVPAGSFNHVFPVKEDFTWELLGREIDHIITTHWVAPNVGSVKFVQEENIGGETITTEAFLKSYSLK
jgi:hypothetical protein